MHNTSSKQQTKQKYKPSHQQTGVPPHSAVPIREKTNKNSAQISPYKKLTQTTGSTLEGQNQKDERIQPSSRKEFNFLEAWEKETSNTITLKKKKRKKEKKRQRNNAQMKEQTRNTEIQINEEEIGKLPEKEFRIMTVKMIKNLENKMEKMQGSINKHLEELKNKHTETNKEEGITIVNIYAPP